MPSVSQPSQGASALEPTHVAILKPGTEISLWLWGGSTCETRAKPHKPFVPMAQSGRPRFLLHQKSAGREEKKKARPLITRPDLCGEEVGACDDVTTLFRQPKQQPDRGATIGELAPSAPYQHL
ncbi:hypothetical protein QC764_0099580 [Podospora pseudoanserina]|uniref:Uncharacterized protein n=1 Tax=Podospora pseudoanserina TaxID=2609844 RepID=A0ABR0HUR5_9PEZI|nr:hypothetical protein QC764_0099580 [Podospora pseudoanserina]